MNTLLSNFRNYQFAFVVLAALAVTGCSKDDDSAPAEENEEEIITDVKLIFTNKNDANDVIEAKAQDPDGEGVQELQILDPINLDVSKTYVLTLKVENNLETPGEDITEEILEEDHEHQFFYSFSNNAFASPLGNGNIDNGSDPLNYSDVDDNNNPVGLSTEWETSATQITGGTFTIRLQHQPDGIKTSTSDATDGDSDFNLQFVLNIE